MTEQRKAPSNRKPEVRRMAIVRRKSRWPQRLSPLFSADGLVTTTGGRTKGMQRMRLDWRHPLAIPALAGAAVLAFVYVLWMFVAALRATRRWLAA